MQRAGSLSSAAALPPYARHLSQRLAGRPILPHLSHAVEQSDPHLNYVQQNHNFLLQLW